MVKMFGQVVLAGSGVAPNNQDLSGQLKFSRAIPRSILSTVLDLHDPTEHFTK